MGYVISRTHSMSFPTVEMAGRAIDSYESECKEPADPAVRFVISRDPLGFWTVDFWAEGLGVIGHLAGEFAAANAGEPERRWTPIDPSSIEQGEGFYLVKREALPSDELRAAIEPFVRYIEGAPAWLKDDHQLTTGSPLARRQVTAGDFRRLAAAAGARA